MTKLDSWEIFSNSDQSELARFSSDLKNIIPTEEDHSGWVLRCYRILANQHLFPSHADVVAALLETGCYRLGYEQGIVFKAISDDVFEVRACCGDSEDYFVGQHVSVQSFSLLQEHQEKKHVAVNDTLSDTTKSINLSYNLKDVRSYLGTSMLLSGRELACICFLSTQPTSGPAKTENILFLELLAEGIAGMMESQKARVQRKSGDLVVHATGSMKTLEDYQLMAKLPENVGIVGRVVEVLKHRIGMSPLGIDNIASDLNLSKRTLQRRLQQQGVSFAELRDSVRFHYSIDCLVNQHISIDRISSTLDFSDRTSFTNAFKRWTGLSPSTFRKVFRDYV